MRPLVLNWSPTSLHGWGVFGINVAYWLARRGLANPLFLAPIDRRAIFVDPARQGIVDAILDESERRFAGFSASGSTTCAMPMLSATGNDFHAPPILSSVDNHCMTFDETGRLSAEGRRRAAGFSTIIAGSSWLGRFLAGEGLDRVKVVLQGVDTRIFNPSVRRRREDGAFVIFSGGKAEFRKGQDIVVAAFRAFRDRHPDAHLVFGWTSVYQNLAATLAMGGLVTPPPPMLPDRRAEVAAWLVENGIPEGSFTDLGLVPNPAMPGILGSVDVALFPNRCEGGTNLVAMEAMACGVPTILSANTGHHDLIREGNCYPLRRQGAVAWTPSGHDPAHWGESDVEEVLAALEDAYCRRDDAEARGREGARLLADMDWETQTVEIARAIGWS
ncbi:MAG: glycosyltransferase family 4 protein [Pseudomonadota bacterium]